MNNTEKKLLEALAYLADNVDEDCPTECRTTHLDEALHDARALMDKMNATTNGGTMNTYTTTIEAIGNWDGQEAEAVECWNHWVAPALAALQERLGESDNAAQAIGHAKEDAWESFCNTDDEESFPALGQRIAALVSLENTAVRITLSTMQGVLAALHLTWTMLEEPEGWSGVDRAELCETVGCLIAKLNKEGYP